MGVGGVDRVRTRSGRQVEPQTAALSRPVPETREVAEHTIVRMHRSARRMVLPGLVFLAVCGTAPYFWRTADEAWLKTVVVVAAVLVVVALVLVPYLRWLSGVVIVTSRRLVVRSGVIVRNRTEFLLGSGSEATLRRGPVQLLVGSGDVIVHAGAQGTIILRDVPHARLVFGTVGDLIREGVGTAGIQPATRSRFR